MPICIKCEADVEKYANGKKCRECYNAYMAMYMLERYHRRRTEAIELLGGKCVRCGSTEELEFDHVERALKTGEVAKWFSRGEARYKQELEKCQLLCKICHIEKSRDEMSVEHGGGLTGKRNCYCKKCAPLKRAYNAQWKRERRQKRINGSVSQLASENDS